MFIRYLLHRFDLEQLGIIIFAKVLFGESWLSCFRQSQESCSFWSIFKFFSKIILEVKKSVNQSVVHILNMRD